MIKLSNKILYISYLFNIVLYRIMLDITYGLILTKYFAHGIESYSLSYTLSSWILSWIIVAIFIFPIIQICINNKRPTNIIMTVFSFVLLIPFTTMIFFNNFSLFFIILNTIFWLLLFLSHILLGVIGIITIKIPTKLNKLIFPVIAFILIMTVIYISGTNTQFRIITNLYDVYKIRFEELEISKIQTYILGFSKIILPLLLALSFNKKKYLFSLIICITLFLRFGIDGVKAIFFITFIEVICCLFYKENYYKFIPFCFSTLVLFSLLEYIIFKSYYIVDFLIRRLMFLTNKINYFYYNYFSQHEPDFYRQSFLRYFGFSSPYKIKISNLIGQEYFNDFSYSANSGLVSEALANWGYIGIFILPIILALLFKIFDICCYKIQTKIYIALMIYISYILFTAFIPTALLTHGLIVLCMFFILIPKSGGIVKY